MFNLACRPSSNSFSFFFYCSRDHRDLHSFPTRRSSDLMVQLTRPCQPPASYAPLFRAASRSAPRGPPLCLHGAYARSEEHTSELQSQSNLVCRLLLEKKKHTKRKSLHHVID